jgi:hypothetical protein
MLVMWYMMKMFTGGNKGQQGGAGGKDAKVGRGSAVQAQSAAAVTVCCGHEPECPPHAPPACSF